MPKTFHCILDSGECICAHVPFLQSLLSITMYSISLFCSMSDTLSLLYQRAIHRIISFVNKAITHQRERLVWFAFIDTIFNRFRFLVCCSPSAPSIAGEKPKYTHPDPMLELLFSFLPVFQPLVTPSHPFPFHPKGRVSLSRPPQKSQQAQKSVGQFSASRLYQMQSYTELHILPRNLRSSNFQPWGQKAAVPRLNDPVRSLYLRSSSWSLGMSSIGT